MNILDIENRRLKLIERINQPLPLSLQLIEINLFIDYLLNQENNNILEAYIPEFIHRYLILLGKIEMHVFNPAFYSVILTNLNQLKDKDFAAGSELEAAVHHVQEHSQRIESLLNGIDEEYETNKKLLFPLLLADKQTYKDDIYGLIESITIKLEITSGDTSFIIIPSEKELDNHISEQIKTSWDFAQHFLFEKEKIRPGNYEVIISFDKRHGIYRGYSLGVALTLGLISSLLGFHNSASYLEVRNGIAFTGGINRQGTVKNISGEKIKEKIKCVFFSGINSIVVPREDEAAAREELETLLRQFPKRKLNIVSAASFDDVVNRRDLINLGKRKIWKRSYNYWSSNFPMLFIILALLVFLLFNLIGKFDDNPASLMFKNNIVSVLNSSGEILWTHRTNINFSNSGYENAKKNIAMLIDINDDGRNEVLICNEASARQQLPEWQGRIACFSPEQKIIWQYIFSDSVSTEVENHSVTYDSYLVDINKENNSKVLYAFARNTPGYPSAIFRLNVENGKRLPNTLWHAGHIQDAIVKDFDADGNKELVSIAINNGLERCAIFSIDLKKLEGTSPAPADYSFNGMEVASFNNYVLLPKSDYNEFMGYRFNTLGLGTLEYFEKTNAFDLILYEAGFNSNATISLRVTDDLKNFSFSVSDVFHSLRDSFVEKGYLSKPYTSTAAYSNYLNRQILYWNGAGFVEKKSISK